jgi:membrane protein implicated in regulation of membrane protease activity
LLLVMRLLLVHEVQRLLDSDIAGLLLLYLLALTTFLGGIYLDWRLCVVGIFLGLGAVAIAFLDEAALPMLALAVVIVVVFALWSQFRRKTESSSQSATEPVQPAGKGDPERG